jgi:hypothetical protein
MPFNSFPEEIKVSCHSVSLLSPAARWVSRKSWHEFICANSDTLSCGKKELSNIEFILFFSEDGELVQYAPQVADLNIQLRHSIGYLLSRHWFSVELEGGALGGGGEEAPNDEVGPALRTFQLDFDVTLLSSIFNEGIEVASTTEHLSWCR